MEKKKKRHWLWIVPAIIIVIVAVSLLGRRRPGSYEINSVAVGTEELSEAVTATGVVQPVYKVTVGTQVSGIVKKLYVDYNSRVKQGQLLAELDKSLLEENVKLHRANLSVATSQKSLAEKDFERVKQLFAQRAATQEEYDQTEARLEQAANQLVTAKANYDNAVTELRYAEIHSPIDGVVISKQVEEGQTVQGAYSVPNLFTIAKNLTEIQVEAKVDEADIGQVREGQQTSFKVDAYPGEEFKGTVDQIRMEPQMSNNVVTYIVIIKAENPDEKLFPGMTASVSINVQSDTGLCLPIYATQLRVDEATLADLRRQGYTIDTGGRRSEVGGRKSEVGSRTAGGGAATHVWLKEGQQLTRRPVSLGTKTKVKVIVTDGLTEGDTVVTSIVNYAQQRADRKRNMFE
jgi:HlyD family secretion protein